jgi:phospholipid/cholesterol/gamma-HCH transport system substrate-binding protein
MTNERNSLKAGIFILVCIGVVIAIVIGIKGVGRFLEPTQEAAVVFALVDDIGGLGTGDEVRLGGAKVGVVRDVEIEVKSDNEQQMLVSFTFPRRFVLRKDAVVAVQSTVTGVSVLNFSSLGTGELLQSGDTIVGKPAALTALLSAGPDLVEIVRSVKNTTIPNVNRATVKVNDTLDSYKQTSAAATELIQQVKTKVDPAIDKYNNVADSTRSAMQNASELLGDVKGDVRTTIANLREATGIVRQGLPGLLQQADGVLAGVNNAVKQTNEALVDVKKIAVNTRDATASARSMLYTNRGRIEQMIMSLKLTGDNLKNASAELRRSPWRLLYRPADGASDLSEAAVSLRDALADPDVDPAQIQKLIDRLDNTFSHFSTVEKELWDQVQE